MKSFMNVVNINDCTWDVADYIGNLKMGFKLVNTRLGASMVSTAKIVKEVNVDGIIRVLGIDVTSLSGVVRNIKIEFVDFVHTKDEDIVLNEVSQFVTAVASDYGKIDEFFVNYLASGISNLIGYIPDEKVVAGGYNLADEPEEEFKF